MIKKEMTCEGSFEGNPCEEIITEESSFFVPEHNKRFCPDCFWTMTDFEEYYRCKYCNLASKDYRKFRKCCSSEVAHVKCDIEVCSGCSKKEDDEDYFRCYNCNEWSCVNHRVDDYACNECQCETVEWCSSCHIYKMC